MLWSILLLKPIYYLMACFQIVELYNLINDAYHDDAQDLVHPSDGNATKSMNKCHFWLLLNSMHQMH